MSDMTNEQSSRVGALVPCPYCDGELTILLTLHKDDVLGLRLGDPTVVIDRHLAVSPNCPLSAWDVTDE